MRNISFQFSWKSCFCEYIVVWMWVAPLRLTNDPDHGNNRSLTALTESSQVCVLCAPKSGQCVTITNIMCHLVQALDSVSQTGNDMSSRLRSPGWPFAMFCLIQQMGGLQLSQEWWTHPMPPLTKRTLVGKMSNCVLIFLTFHAFIVILIIIL